MLRPEIDDIIDGFIVRQRLHDGAAASVFKAVDSFSSDRWVVLKIPLDNIFNKPQLFYHYQNEEVISRYLNHPGTVRYLTRPTSRLYLVQEFVEGDDLKSVLQQHHRLPVDRAVAICRKICRALDYLHTQSIIHLDLKPENIMVTPVDDVKLLDFGLARHLGLRDLIADDFSEPHGTPHYISPEQLCGKRDSCQSDIYSLGFVLYEMLTGALPFDRSEKLAKVRLRLKKKPLPPRYYVSDLHPALQQIILRMLEADLERRYATVEELDNDLANYRQISLTLRGYEKDEPGSFFDYLLPADCAVYQKQESPPVAVQMRARQLLGCIIDDDSSWLVIEELKREALTDGGRITLLTVQEEDLEPVEVEHANEIAGSSLAARLDSSISYLRKYDLDVTLRIRKGPAAEQIAEIADGIGADLTILGPPRQTGGLTKLLAFLGGATISRVTRLLDRPLRVLQPASSGAGPCQEPGESWRESQRETLRVFLADLWVFHLNWLLQAIEHPQYSAIPSVSICPFGKWIEGVGEALYSPHLLDQIRDTHAEYHASVEEIIQLRERNSDFTTFYRQTALPLSEKLKKQLENFVSEQQKMMRG